MKLAVVVQRYGADINGGAELHARYIAERLSRHASVEVVTTCARDYVTWKNELPAGVEQVNGITVRRFPVAHEREAARLRPALGPGVRERALDRRRARLARQRRAGEPGAGEPCRAGGRRSRLRRPLQLSLLPRVAPGAADSGEGGHRPDRGTRSGDRPLDFRPGAARRPRPHVQLAGRARDDPGGREQRGRPRRRRRRRLGRARSHRPGAVPAQVQDQRGRSRSTSAGSTRTRAAASSSPTSSATRRRSRGASTWSSSAARSSTCRSIRASTTWVPRRPRQVRRARRLGPADHAVVLREPVDGGARGVGARPAGARQRALRRAERPVHPEQRRPVLRELRGVRRGALLARVERPAERAARPERPRVLQAELRLAGHRAQVPRHVRAAQEGPSPATGGKPRLDPLPGWFARRKRDCRRRGTSSTAIPGRASAA